ncbi:hypothetical protein [Haliscomenobacter hydrossis]|uniref:Uncharacterized protein n=1 Tax=Haliscomenobacter hydrossis (strain ATCC 27775 / DSM 1100 / LMG 10767 / O) TaxID=760192 RepID=F4KS04_HALH1|nr:hypothetical protein [Haliscomenobacter hydrossis]AEE51091.1 hypothetical protein Halhy_3231 [Haliscomenobacter hydrossis DSM 1100]
MKRIYLDWNVVSNLKRESYQKLKELLLDKNYSLLIPYSSAHFDDLMKSNMEGNVYFNQDMENLTTLCGDHLLTWDLKLGIIPSKCLLENYQIDHVDKKELSKHMDFNFLVEDLDEGCQELGIPRMGNLLKTLWTFHPTGIEITEENSGMLKKMFPNLTSDSSMWDLLQDIGPFAQKLMQDREYYKDFRKSINESGFKVEANSGNWDAEDVIHNIDSFLMRMGVDMSCVDLATTSFKDDAKSNTHYNRFTSSYNMLDMIGYKSDKLPKQTDSFQNVATDGEHAFFASYCDIFVVGDKKLASKAQVLYHEFNIDTLIVSPDDFQDDFENIIGKIGKNDFELLEEVVAAMSYESPIEYRPSTEDHPVEVSVYKLPFKYFDYFTHVIHSIDFKEKVNVLTFMFSGKYQSKFAFFTELESLFDQATKSYGITFDDYDSVKNKFVYDDNFGGAYWSMGNIFVHLGRQEVNSLPSISFSWPNTE